MDIVVSLTIIYCIYLHYRIAQLQQTNTSFMLDIIDDYCELEGKIKQLKKKVRKRKTEKCCNEKPRRKPAKIRSRVPKTKISKD